MRVDTATRRRALGHPRGGSPRRVRLSGGRRAPQSANKWALSLRQLRQLPTPARGTDLARRTVAPAAGADHVPGLRGCPAGQQHERTGCTQLRGKDQDRGAVPIANGRGAQLCLSIRDLYCNQAWHHTLGRAEESRPALAWTFLSNRTATTLQIEKFGFVLTNVT